MYKELVSSIEIDLSKFKIPELERRHGKCGTPKGAENAEYIDYVIYRGDKEGHFDIKIYSSDNGDYVFSGTKETILARLTELWVNE